MPIPANPRLIDWVNRKSLNQAALEALSLGDPRDTMEILEGNDG